MHLVHDWAVFDARPSENSGGAFTLALISLRQSLSLHSRNLP
jgi:hypothetical protein